MQTFVPYANMHESAVVLDRQRLGKQRVETLQILRALCEGGGWVNHPATKMWRGHESGLAAYGIAVCDAWTARGYKDTCKDKIVAFKAPNELDLPEWWGNDAVHASHRSNLLRKSPEHYGQFGWTEGPDLEYVWPS